MTSVREEDVGCTCFVNDCSGMTGIIKHKFSDFHVHEIDRNGEVQYLTSLSPLPPPSYPPGYEDWLSSDDIFFRFTPTSEAQVARIYYEQPTMDITYTATHCTIERKFKRRPRQLITAFTMCKANMNQQQAISLIAKKAGTQKKNIGFAGTKDKRGVTTQTLTIKDVPPARLAEVAASLGDSVRIGQFRECINPISLGENAGNRFTILVRDVAAPERGVPLEEAVGRRLSALAESGFLNYFGMQRFGTGRVPTHHYGILILKRDWRALVDLLVAPQDGELEGTRRAKLLYQQTGDARAALRLVPKAAQAEYAVFQALAEGRASDPHELFRRVDRRQRMLYVHAYQSYLWNHAASLRWARHGASVAAGDFVASGSGAVQVSAESPRGYSIFDVVIPLPSREGVAPEVAELMARDGVTPEMFAALSSEYGAGGDWRRLVIRPEKLEWEVIRYDDPDALLIDSDIDRLEGVSHREQRKEGGRRAALCVSFSLGSGQYATMCLRELLKRSTEWFTDSEMSKGGKSRWPFGCTIQ